MTTILRWVVVALLVGHGLIHLLGVVKGFGLAEIPLLTKPISAAGGLLWLLAAASVLTAATLLAFGAPTWWWTIALAAAAISEIAIATSWADARAGTIVNVVLVLAAGLGLAAEGPSSFHSQYRERANQALTQVDASQEVVTESDLVDLPRPLADYIRRSGAVGQPRVSSFHAEFHGRIRSGPDAAWMPFTGQQVNTYGPRARRIFLMDATRSGLPVTVLHVFVDTAATMHVKLLSFVTVVNASGPEMDRGETVTVFNDLVAMAPGAIVGAPVRWTGIDAQHVRGVFTDGEQTVSAVLTFDADHDLVDFTSDDRSRASADGKTFTPQHWSTPLSGQHDAHGRRVIALGRGVWGTGPGSSFTYLEFHLDAIHFNVGSSGATAQSATVITTTRR